jgi:hypothetical protein
MKGAAGPVSFADDGWAGGSAFAPLEGATKKPRARSGPRLVAFGVRRSYRRVLARDGHKSPANAGHDGRHPAKVEECSHTESASPELDVDAVSAPGAESRRALAKVSTADSPGGVERDATPSGSRMIVRVTVALGESISRAT